jgi:predicted protein tyrosine phosphatase
MQPILKIRNHETFKKADLTEFGFALSIQAKGSSGMVLRPDFQGQRLNLYFDDVLEAAPGAATPADIDVLFRFALQWLSTALSDPTLASVVIHCTAGISRSAASALMLFTLYFSDYQRAAAHLFRTHRHVIPNPWMCRLIFERLGPAYGADILGALTRGKEAASRST